LAHNVAGDAVDATIVKGRAGCFLRSRRRPTPYRPTCQTMTGLQKHRVRVVVCGFFGNAQSTGQRFLCGEIV
jgi:hypothetical protein